MDLAQFRQSLAADNPPRGLGRPLSALWHEARGDWERAHRIVQSEKGKTAAAVHAYLHRKEGDRDNARYWYERAGRAVPRVSHEKEWETLVRSFLESFRRRSR